MKITQLTLKQYIRLYLQNSKILLTLRFCSDEFKQPVPRSSIQKVEEKPNQIYRIPEHGEIYVKYWNEWSAIRRERKKSKFPYSIENITDLLIFFQSFNNFPFTPTEIYHHFRRRAIRKNLVEQKYLPQRAQVLKPDLAAAHFLIRRGASIKFKGHSNWVGLKEKKKMLPMAYVPGLFIESIKAEGTNLYYEGLQNLEKLRYLTYLSLKNLQEINDWCLDWLSNEYYLSLKHLDLSGCKNVTYRGLSCFYRFECLEVLEVEGIPDPPEFKVACLMLLDIMPHLEIKGIDLNIPKKIEPIISEEEKRIEQS